MRYITRTDTRFIIQLYTSVQMGRLAQSFMYAGHIYSDVTCCAVSGTRNVGISPQIYAPEIPTVLDIGAF